MEMIKTASFEELSVTEINETNGGFFAEALAFGVGCIIGRFIYNDLRNCYENGYAEGKALVK